MDSISKLIVEVKSNSNVDNFTSNIEKEVRSLVEGICLDIENHKSTDFCGFKQADIAKLIRDKYLKD
jgi:pSer/pThr/pTyr-binding forkhead associated (FHA) protein